jgi:glycosyltransferase involved in cell wall biosynthesis
VIGIVAIGRNEGDRLCACLEAARALAPDSPLVYVDSGSTDNSVELARSLHASVVTLDLSTSFTAARSRNAGFRRLKEIAPHVRYVQFLDGDCALQPGWLATAAGYLDAHADVAVVCGRRRERFPNASVYNKLADLEWNTPIGPARSCGGDAMFRVEPFERAGGYDDDVIAGEEPELCVRLRALGMHVMRLDHEMTLHDAAMTRFGQWWKRNIRAGHAYAEGNDRHGGPPERFAEKAVRSNLVWGLLVPIAVVVATLAIGVWHPRYAWVPVLLGLMALTLLAGRVTRYRVGRGDRLGDAVLYGLFTVLGKTPQMLGQLKYRSNKHAGLRTKLIEYKAAA